ncbi:MAG: 4-diphosphocytidyl-2C-methyl-D-erythritol kinase [Alphaproteobacteria bacterium]|nr:4-diphosphocytidyl-2C-methyl-D-erythritol kinase [Alphaproteobacteria bacterium]
MRFGPLPLADCDGAILAHTVKLATDTFKKGRVLTAEDVAKLKAAGFSHAMAAKLEDGDMHEDPAANALAEACAGTGVRAAAAFTGRANLISEVHGVVLAEPDRVNAVNAVDEALTIATVPHYSVVRPRQLVATIKVIPFSAPKASVEGTVRRAQAGPMPLVTVIPFQDKPVGLIQTWTESTKESVLDKTTVTIRERLAAFGSHLKREIRVPHNTQSVQGALMTLLDDHCHPILIVGASAIVDRRDVIPAAIARAGGHIERFGMPVDPGNLMLLAYHNDTAVVGAPGCARSPKTNGFDWVLARLCAEIPVGRADIQAMGAGGLLTDVAARPFPRTAGAEADEHEVPEAAQIAAVILAGGKSSRAGGVNKLLATLNGKPLIAHVADAMLATAARPVVVVTGHQEEAVRAALGARTVHFAHNPSYADGLSASLRAGLAKLAEIAPDADGALIALGDMPRVKAKQLDKLLSAFAPHEGRSICVPTFAGKRGNPVLWSKEFFAPMTAVAGDTGARHLIGEHADAVCEVAMDDDAIFVDVDTPEALAAIGAVATR